MREKDSRKTAGMPGARPIEMPPLAQVKVCWGKPVDVGLLKLVAQET